MEEAFNFVGMWEKVKTVGSLKNRGELINPWGSHFFKEKKASFPLCSNLIKAMKKELMHKFF